MRPHDPSEAAIRMIVDVAPRLARSIAVVLEDDPRLQLSVRQYRILELVIDRPRRATDLAAESMISQQTTSAAIRALLKRDLVHLRADPSDGRATLIELSQGGAKMVDLCRSAIFAHVREVLKDLSIDERSALLDAQPKIEDGMRRAWRDRTAARSG